MFDLSKECNIVALDAYYVLLYIVGLLPVVPGVVTHCGDLGKLSFRPAKLERDDHLVIVKLPFKGFDYSQLNNIIIKTLSKELRDQDFVKIAQMMKKMMSTIKRKNKLSEKIDNIHLTTKLSEKTKCKILSAWFSDAILGPFCITRSLHMIEFSQILPSNAICCQTTNKLRYLLPFGSFWDFEMDHAILMDKNYFVISGQDNVAMEYPRRLIISTLD